MAATFTMILMCLAVLNVSFAMPAAQPAEVATNEDMKTAETSYGHLPFSFGFVGYPRYSPYGYGFRNGLGISIGYPTPYSHSFGYSYDYPQYLSQFK
ncbi:hypothetical protein QTP88_023415 [Uroleucon formosanum]